jgi:nucleotide-binding universal stress UspA family protein
MAAAEAALGLKEPKMPGIVVGIDGSRSGQQTLEWAVRQAVTGPAPLTVLTVHPVATSAWTGAPIRYPAEDRPEEEKARQAAQQAADQAVSELGARPGQVTVRAVSGLPARELIEASADADLIVVGSRGHGGFAGLPLGSVSSQVVSHAACPVVVVRH